MMCGLTLAYVNTTSDSLLFSDAPSPTILFLFNDTATTEIYTLSLHDALPICAKHAVKACLDGGSHHTLARIEQRRERPTGVGTALGTQNAQRLIAHAGEGQQSTTGAVLTRDEAGRQREIGNATHQVEAARPSRPIPGEKPSAQRGRERRHAIEHFDQ